VNANVLATKQTRTLNLFDLPNDRLLSVYDPYAAKTSAAPSPWQKPDPTQGCPWGVIPLDGPFLLRDGWFYSARPFARMVLADGRTEKLPPPRTDYPFEVTESLQFVDDGKRILVADQYSTWLLELGPEPARASADNGGNNSTSSDSAKHPSKSVEQRNVNEKNEITTYTFTEPGLHTIQWKGGGASVQGSLGLESNIIKLEVVKQ
jgi:hypothetical protein